MGAGGTHIPHPPESGTPYQPTAAVFVSDKIVYVKLARLQYWLNSENTHASQAELARRGWIAETFCRLVVHCARARSLVVPALNIGAGLPFHLRCRVMCLPPEKSTPSEHRQRTVRFPTKRFVFSSGTRYLKKGLG